MPIISPSERGVCPGHAGTIVCPVYAFRCRIAIFASWLVFRTLLVTTFAVAQRGAD